jgi:hypothetical protein
MKKRQSWNWALKGNHYTVSVAHYSTGSCPAAAASGNSTVLSVVMARWFHPSQMASDSRYWGVQESILGMQRGYDEVFVFSSTPPQISLNARQTSGGLATHSRTAPILFVSRSCQRLHFGTVTSVLKHLSATEPLHTISLQKVTRVDSLGICRF